MRRTTSNEDACIRRQTRKRERGSERERTDTLLFRRRPQTAGCCCCCRRRLEVGEEENAEETQSHTRSCRETRSMKKCLGFGDGTKSLSAADPPFTFSFIWPNIPRSALWAPDVRRRYLLILPASPPDVCRRRLPLRYSFSAGFAETTRRL